MIDSVVGDCKRFAIMMLIVENPPNIDFIFQPLCSRSRLFLTKSRRKKAPFGARTGLYMISWSHKWLLMAVIRYYTRVDINIVVQI